MAELIVHRVKATGNPAFFPGFPHIIMQLRILVDHVAQKQDLPTVLRRLRPHRRVEHVDHRMILALVRIDQVDIAQFKLIPGVKEHREPFFKAIVGIKPFSLEVQIVKGQIRAEGFSRVIRQEVLLERGFGLRQILPEVHRNLHQIRMLAEPLLQVEHFIAFQLNHAVQIRVQLSEVILAVLVKLLRLKGIGDQTADNDRDHREQDKPYANPPDQALFFHSAAPRIQESR